MDRALDEVIGERQKESRNNNRGGGGRNRRREPWPRDGARKNGGDRSNIDDDWIHDKFEPDDEGRGSRRPPRNRSYRRDSPEPETEQGFKIRVENLHYDLSEDDLLDLFTRIAPVSRAVLTYDRAGRSTGTAYVTYHSNTFARKAIREYDGANAFGQPIRLSMVPSGPSNRGAGGGSGGRNPFDSAVKPGRSLFDRIEGAGRNRDRSRSPRRSDMTKPAPDGIDRYIPSERSRSPRRRRGDRGDRGGRGDSRNNSRRGDGPRRGRREGDGRATTQGRPRRTQEDLDKDMDEYWNKKNNGGGEAASEAAQTSAAVPFADGDVDMAE